MLITIQNRIRKTAVSQRSLPHVVTSPYTYKMMSGSKVPALNSYHFTSF